MVNKKRNKKPIRSGKKRYIWLWFGATLFIAAIAVVSWRVSVHPPTPVSQNLKAAIVDQLSTTYPNDNFNAEVTACEYRTLSSTQGDRTEPPRQ